MIKKISLTLVILVFAISGCSSSDNQLEANQDLTGGIYENTPSQESVVEKNNQSVEPFDEYNNTDQKSYVISKGINILLNQCMSKRGFPDANAKEDSKNEDNDHKVSDAEWGLIDLEAAKKYAYTPQFITETGEIDSNTNHWVPSFSSADPNDIKNTPEFKHAYEGDEGCDEQSTEEFYRGITFDLDHSNQVGEIQIATTKNAKNDTIMQKKVVEWSNCMQKNGFNIKEPPTQDAEIQGEHSDEEYIQIAVADVECKEKVHFMDPWTEILYKYERDAIQANLPLFEEQKEYIDKLVARAQEIITRENNTSSTGPSETTPSSSSGTN